MDDQTERDDMLTSDAAKPIIGRNLINETLATPHSYHEARIQLPLNAKWSTSFGNPGEGGYTEFWRTPEGVRYTISNGPWHLIECEFDWHCQRVEERA